MIRLIGPGGAGKSTIGALLAARLGVAFLDLDQHVAAGSETSARKTAETAP